MLGWFSLAQAWASRKKRARSSSVISISGEMTFSATCRSRMGSWALKIMPMPPRPIRSTTRYFPIFSGRRAALPPTLTMGAGSRGVASEDRADVVATALGVGGRHQRVAASLQIGAVSGHDLVDAAVRQHVAEPVRAQQHDVAVGQLLAGHLEVHVVAGAQGLGQHVLHRGAGGVVERGPRVVGQV